MKKLVLSLSLVLAFSSATAAFAAIPQNIRIGTDPTYAPFESKNSQGELVGFDIDLAKELCKRINTHQYAMYVCRKSAGCVNPVLKSEED
ncbi:histidine-binding periplasmic protein [Escherichia coli O104:H4 str. Ec12-0466]|nr:histidine-binding periplasmic protein [Escherichia coli O104:H4 str. Ec12-0466]